MKIASCLDTVVRNGGWFETDLWGYVGAHDLYKTMSGASWTRTQTVKQFFFLKVCSLRPWYSLMHEDAPSHTASHIIQKFNYVSSFPIMWPAVSPDSNLIKAVWNLMEVFRLNKYLVLASGTKSMLDQLSVFIRKAWVLVTTEELSSLVSSMPGTCQAVVEPDDGWTKYQPLRYFVIFVQTIELVCPLVKWMNVNHDK